MTVGDLGKPHRIHGTMNNHQDEHRYTMIETSGMILDQQISILIDPIATESLISSGALKIIAVKEIEQDEFRYV
jgi:hypothetical protein